MKLYISNISTWCPYDSDHNLPSTKSTSDQAVSNIDFSWPKLDFVPAMQRRRLSPFAKISLYVANKTLEHDGKTQNLLPIVFSSRHGDIHKTSILLENLAQQEMLSPTAFALSVHNAVPSLYSILTENKAAINAIAAGQDSFFMAIVDAYVRLASGICDEVLFIHADQNLPEIYDTFKDEQQIAHSVAMKISLKESASSHAIECSYTHNDKAYIEVDNNNNILLLPAALSFSQWVNNQEIELNYYSKKYHWHCKKI
jgi:hypothetical protein